MTQSLLNNVRNIHDYEKTRLFKNMIVQVARRVFVSI